jgi:hypothetical protein
MAASAINGIADARRIGNSQKKKKKRSALPFRAAFDNVRIVFVDENIAPQPNQLTFTAYTTSTRSRVWIWYLPVTYGNSCPFAGRQLCIFTL